LAHVRECVAALTEAGARLDWADDTINKKTLIDNFLLVERELSFYREAFCLFLPNARRVIEKNDISRLVFSKDWRKYHVDYRHYTGATNPTHYTTVYCYDRKQ